MTDRASLPDWPRLMAAELAADYLGVSASTFRTLGIVPLNIGRRVLWDRVSLDIYVDRISGQPLSEDATERAAAEQERAFLAKFNRG